MAPSTFRRGAKPKAGKMLLTPCLAVEGSERSSAQDLGLAAGPPKQSIIPVTYSRGGNHHSGFAPSNRSMTCRCTSYRTFGGLGVSVQACIAHSALSIRIFTNGVDSPRLWSRCPLRCFSPPTVDL